MSIVFLFSAVNQPIPRLSSPKASQDILSSKSHHSSKWVRHLKKHKAVYPQNNRIGSWALLHEFKCCHIIIYCHS